MLSIFSKINEVLTGGVIGVVTENNETETPVAENKVTSVDHINSENTVEVGGAIAAEEEIVVPAEATGEATSEATGEAASEANAEVTGEVTGEVTAEANAEATGKKPGKELRKQMRKQPWKQPGDNEK